MAIFRLRERAQVILAELVAIEDRFMDMIVTLGMEAARRGEVLVLPPRVTEYGDSVRSRNGMSASRTDFASRLALNSLVDSLGLPEDAWIRAFEHEGVEDE